MHLFILKAPLNLSILFHLHLHAWQFNLYMKQCVGLYTLLPLYYTQKALQTINCSA